MPNSYSFAHQPNPRERTMPNWKLEGTVVVEDENAPEVEPDESFDPADHTVDDVKSWVEANPDYAPDVLEAEEAGKNRVTLVEWLTNFGAT